LSEQIDNYYLLISRLRPYKKIDLAIRAFNQLKIPLKIVGTGQDKELRKIAGPHIEFVGSVSDEEKTKYLSHCRAVIFPQEEDFGLVAVEAMASGRPVIAYRAGGALEIVEENKTGVFFNEQTWESLAEAVIKFDAQKFNPALIKERAERFSKARFKKEFLDLVNKGH
ncbi:MAG: glycosyltransferase, partial [Candidatus Parcubacteria bacterium]|nr:glycosyltransferase [Candidatus Parcubacteria bacterium]